MNCVNVNDDKVLELAKTLDENPKLVAAWIGTYLEYFEDFESFPNEELLNEFVFNIMTQEALKRGGILPLRKNDFFSDMYKNMTPVTKIISGGQTGVDRLGLEFGRDNGIETGGTAPPGFYTEGAKDLSLAYFGVVEISKEIQNGRSGRDFFNPRTEQNVINSDGTVYFATNEDSAGLISTRRFANNHKKPFILNPTPSLLRLFLIDKNIKTLNIAGNRMSRTTKEHLDQVKSTLFNAFFNYDLQSEDYKEDQPKKKEVYDGPIVFNQDYNLNPIDAMSKAQSKLSRLMDPISIQNRAVTIAKLFEKKVNQLVEDRLDSLYYELDNIDQLDSVGMDILNQRISNTNNDSIIQELGVKYILEDVKENDFGVYARMSLLEYQKLFYIDNSDFYKENSFSEAEILDDITKNAEPMKLKYQLVYDNFEALAQKAAITILDSIGVKINIINNSSVNDDGLNDKTSEDQNSLNELDMSAKEDGTIQIASAEARTVSLFDSLSSGVKRMISQIPRTDTDGLIQVDDMNIPLMLDKQFVYSVLVKQLAPMTSYKDLDYMLDKMSIQYNWVSTIQEKINEDPTLKALFFKNFRSDHIQYYGMSKKKNTDGSFNIEVYDINKSSTTSLISNWRQNIVTGTILNKDLSIYNSQAELVHDNLIKLEKEVNELNKKLTQKGAGEIKALIHRDENISKLIVKFLRAVGIEVDYNDLKNIMAKPDIEKNGLVIHNNSYQKIIKALLILSKKPNNQDDSKKEDIINQYSNAYKEISSVLGQIDDLELESSFREGGKTRYAHAVPSYLLKIIKELGQSTENEAKFNEFVESNYGNVEFFRNKNGVWMNQWLKELVNDPSARKNIKHSVLLSVDKQEYDKWSPKEVYQMMVNMYFSEDGISEYAKYIVPIMSDALSAEFIRFKRYTGEVDEFGNNTRFEDLMLPMFRNLIFQELIRMKTVVARANGLITDDSIGDIEAIKNYDLKGKNKGEYTLDDAKFSFLVRLNDITIKDGEFKTIQSYLNNLIEKRDTPKLIATTNKLINRVMDEGFNEYIKALNNEGVLELAENKKLKLFTFMNELNYMDKLKEYYWNSALATSLIVLLTTTDYSFYSTPEDFMKRFKLVHSPSKKLYVDALFLYQDKEGNYETITPSSKQYKTIVLKDDDSFVSTSIGQIRSILLARVDSGLLTKMDMDSILNKFKNINVADAQAYRSLKSFRDVYIMAGLWTNEMEDAYRNLNSGKWDMNDFYNLWQPIKPFVFTLNVQKSGIEGVNIKVPVQYKNSEFLLLAIFNQIASVEGNSPKLKAILRFMDNNGISVILFESALKVGLRGVVDLNSSHTYEETYKALSEKALLNKTPNLKNLLDESTGLNDGDINYLVVLVSSYEDYGIQVETPEHMVDHSGLRGTLITKLITMDISDDAVFNIPYSNKVKSKKDLIDTFNNIVTENYREDFLWVKLKLETEKNISDLLVEEYAGNPRVGYNALRLVLLNSEGRISVPLNEKSQSTKIQNTLSSIFKSRITKQKIAGGALILATAYGLTDELNIVFKDKDGKDLMTRKEYLESDENNTQLGYEEYAKSAVAVSHLEAYMPWYTAKYFLPLLKEGSHVLDVSKIKDKSLLDVIGYRIPTEDKYSMFPIRIKGFLPKQSGGAIMLPADVTTMAGLDFDVDKLFIMRPEFKVKTSYDVNRFVKFLIDIMGGLGSDKMESIKSIIYNYINNVEQDLNLDEKSVIELFNVKKQLYKTESILKVKYDWSKDARDLSKEARNNGLIDIMWSVLTNTDTALKTFTPGGFDDHKKAARIVSIVSSVNSNDLVESLGLNNENEIYDSLNSMPLKLLDKFYYQIKPLTDPLSPSTFAGFHLLNMAGGSSIGIFANHNVNHSMLQQSDLKISKSKAFYFDGLMLTDLNLTKNTYGLYISSNNAGYLAASVDNAKDPVLGFLNLNTFTIDTAMLLSRLGYTPLQVGLFMSLPIIKHLSKVYFEVAQTGGGYKLAYKKVLYENGINEIKGVFTGLKTDTSNKALLNGILDFNEDYGSINVMEFSKSSDKLADYQRQILYLFNSMYNVADELKSIVSAMRADTGGGAFGPTNADSISKIEKVFDAFDSEAESSFNNKSMMQPYSDLNNDDYSSGTVQLTLSAYKYGLLLPSKEMSKYFPEFSTAFKYSLDLIKEQTSNNRLSVNKIQSIHDLIYQFYFSGLPFFGDEIVEGGEELTISQKRDLLIKGMPTRLMRLKNNPKTKDIEFVKRLVVFGQPSGGIQKIGLLNSGKMHSSVREKMTSDWASLLYIQDEEANKFAVDLFRYSYYIDGFGYTHSSFMNLAPIEVLLSMPGYIEKNRDMASFINNMSSEQAEGFSYKFYKLYIVNNITDTSIVPKVDISEFNETNKGLIRSKSEDIVIENETSLELKNLAVLRTVKTKNGEQDIYRDFIAVTDNDKTYYLALNVQGSYFVFEDRLAKNNNIKTYNINVDHYNDDFFGDMNQYLFDDQAFGALDNGVNMNEYGLYDESLLPLPTAPISDDAIFYSLYNNSFDINSFNLAPNYLDENNMTPC